MKTFDANDCYIEQRCTEAEIGTSWEPRWGVSDLREGACKPNMVGLPMPMQIDIDTPDADQLKDIPPEFVYEYELADYHHDRAAYRAKGGNVLALIKIGEERKLRQSSEQATLAKLSATKLRGMDDQDILLAFVNGILAEADDVRERIMARMDIDHCRPERDGRGGRSRPHLAVLCTAYNGQCVYQYVLLTTVSID